MSEEGLRVMVGQFAEVCKRRRLKVSGSKIKVMVLNGEEGLECQNLNIWSVFWTNQV